MSVLSHINGVAVASVSAIDGISKATLSAINGETIVEESDALVSGAGTGAADGTYTYTGTHNGKRYYNSTGTATNADCIIWNSGDTRWEIWCNTDLGQNAAYSGVEDTTYPWEVDPGNWTELGGDAPVPTVTEA